MQTFLRANSKITMTIGYKSHV